MKQPIQWQANYHDWRSIHVYSQTHRHIPMHQTLTCLQESKWNKTGANSLWLSTIRVLIISGRSSARPLRSNRLRISASEQLMKIAPCTDTPGKASSLSLLPREVEASSVSSSHAFRLAAFRGNPMMMNGKEIRGRRITWSRTVDDEVATLLPSYLILQ